MTFNLDYQGATPKTASVRYVLHRDIAEKKWNVLKRVGLYEDFVQSFDELSDAQDFCDINNGVAEALDGKQ
jgi:hypothetical protein